MSDKAEYTPRVTRDPDGVYRWVATITQKQNRHVYKVAMTVVSGMALLFVIMGFTMGDAEVVMACALSGGAAVAIAGLICWIFDKLAKDGVRQPFEISEKGVRWVGYGRTDFRYSFRSIRRVRIFTSESIIEIHKLLGVMQVYIPHEDFGFVQDYILRRLPAGTDVDYV